MDDSRGTIQGMDVCELEGAGLDSWVARSEDFEIAHCSETGCYVHTFWRQSHPFFYRPLRYQPSQNWSQGGPLLDRLTHMGLEVAWIEAGGKVACTLGPFCMKGEHLLQAAMRCYVASVWGEHLPDE
ncbi:MAG: DUF2591 family protein [Proteobacteria bacterium]|nr:DUF2591 family protein [Pseudomonadota bacterium]MDE3207296.1 DUF2591 family protein [Pseudomonadota bacterium]